MARVSGVGPRCSWEEACLMERVNARAAARLWSPSDSGFEI